MKLRIVGTDEFELRRSATLRTLAIVASAIFLPFPIVAFADACHWGYGNCLPGTLRELASDFGETFSYNFVLGWTLLLFAPVAYRLMRTAPDRTKGTCITFTWVLLLLSKGIMGFIWGPVEPGASEVYLLLPFLTSPIDILLISLFTGWANRRIFQMIGFLASAGLAVVVTVWQAKALIDFMPPLPKGSQVHPTDAGSVIFALLFSLLFFSVPVAVWVTDSRGWTLLAFMKRRHWLEGRE